MAYDGITWNEASPDNSDQASTIDDHMRDLRKSVRSRAALEHVWPSSQVATNEAGYHKFITMSAQTSTPGLVYGTNTQEGAVFLDANNHLNFEDSAGSTYILAKSGVGLVVQAGTGNIGDVFYVTSGGGIVSLAASTSGTVLTAQGTTSAPAWSALDTGSLLAHPSATNQIVQYGSGQCGANANDSVSLATNFANALYRVNVTWMDPNDTSGAVTVQSPLVGTKAAGSFVVINNDNIVRPFEYTAVGSAG